MLHILVFHISYSKMLAYFYGQHEIYIPELIGGVSIVFTYFTGCTCWFICAVPGLKENNRLRIHCGSFLWTAYRILKAERNPNEGV